MKYYLPTKIYSGENVLLQQGERLVLGNRALIVTGRSSGRVSGALDDVERVLSERNVPYLIWDKTSNNPTVEECFEAGLAARDFNADFIIGIGGGSPLDAAKAAAVYAVNNIEPYGIFDCKYDNTPLPMAAVPTTAGTGSEVTQYSVLTVNDEETKKSFCTEDTFYKVAFLDGKYMRALPLTVTRNTAVDAISHLIEGYTNTRASHFTDYMALEGLSIFGEGMSELISGDIKDSTRDKFLWGSTLGGMVIAQTGTTIVHSMGYPLTYYKGLPHGVANGLLLGEYLRETEKVLPDKCKRILSALGVDSVDAFKDLLSKFLPETPTFEKSEIERWVEKTVKAKNAATCPFTATLGIETAIFEKSLL